MNPFDTECLCLRFRCFIPLPQLTEDYERVTLLACLDQDLSKYIVYDVIKLACMVFEIRSIEDYNLAEIFIIDLNNVTVGHAVKYTLPVLKKIEISSKVSSRKFIKTPLIWKLVIRIAKYPDRLGPSGKHFLTVIVLHLFMASIFPRNFQILRRNYVLNFGPGNGHFNSSTSFM